MERLKSQSEGAKKGVLLLVERKVKPGEEKDIILLHEMSANFGGTCISLPSHTVTALRLDVNC